MNPLELEQIQTALPQYDVGGELGRGAFGVVIAAEHRRLGRAAAIKQLPRAFAADPDVRSRFVAEARVLASMNHPHVVPVYDYVEEEGLCLLVMERLTGGTLAESFQSGMMDLKAAVAATLAASSGLHFAHSRGVLHRDVKPDNLMFSSTGNLKVTDFGIAKALDAARTVPTRANDVLGTPAYMAPEQARAAAVSPATDVYALSTVLFELLSGRLPYPDESNALAVLYQHVHEDPIPLRNVAPSVPRAICDVTMRGLAREPEDRYQSARDFALALAGGATHEWGPGWLRELNRIAVLDDEIIATTERTARDSVSAYHKTGGIAETYIGSRVGLVESGETSSPRPQSALPRPRPVPAPPPPTLIPSVVDGELAAAVATVPEVITPASTHEVSAPIPPAPARTGRIVVGVVAAAIVLGALVVSFVAFSSSRGDPTGAPAPSSTVPAASAVPTLRWRFGAGGPVGSSPAVANGVVYVGTHAKAVLALDAETGEVRWRFPTEDIVFSSPRVADGVVYVGGHDKRLLALDAANGTLKWSASFDAPVQSSPALSPSAVFIGADDGTVAAIDRATGADIWRQKLQGGVFASPVFDGSSTVYFATTEGVVTALDASTGTARWSIHIGQVYSSPAIDGDRLYLGDNDREVVALDRNTGSVVWRFSTGDVVGSSPTVVDGIVYVGSHDGNVYAIRADTGGEKWRYRVGNVVFSSPRVGDAVYVGTHASKIIALNPDDGSLEWEYRTDGIVGSSPAIADGSLYVGSDDGNVYALELPTSS